MKKRLCNKYYFSVEGNVEKMYLQWVQKLINQTSNRTRDVNFNIKINKSPKSFAKGLTVTSPAIAYHVTDIESQDEEHVNDLMRELDEMQYVTKNMNRKIKKYELGYSNFTFELWMVLHKDEAFASQNHRRDYLNGINKAFNKDYYSLDDFKKEKEFQTILDTLTLNDIIRAIKRAENIEQRNKTNGFKAINHKGYIYYKENPSLFFHKIIKKVLVDTNLLRN